MQNTRRALQPHRNDSTKGARIIVPVFLPPGKDRPTRSPPPATAPRRRPPEACAVMMNDSSSSSPPALTPADSARSTSDATRRTDHGAGPGGEDDGEDQEHYDADADADADAAAESALLHFSTPRDPATIAALLRPGLPTRVPDLAAGLTSPAALASREQDHRPLRRPVRHGTGVPRTRWPWTTSSRRGADAVTHATVRAVGTAEWVAHSSTEPRPPRSSTPLRPPTPSGCVPVVGVNNVLPSLSRCTGRTARAPSYAVPARFPRRRGFPHRTGTATPSSPLPRSGLAPSAVSVTPAATASAATSPAASTAQ